VREVPEALAPFATTLAPNGMVCSVDHLASSAGVAMLRAGGSAVDAAVAASAVLAVTSQHMCGMGGDLFALVHTPGDPAPACLNASGRSGSGADPDRLRAEGHVTMPYRGDIRSTPVPGCVDGWLVLHERYGRLALADVLEPARRYAADGFPPSPLMRLATALVADLPGGDDYRDVGAVIRRPGVARALEAIVKDGRAGFYEGEFGSGLIELGGGEYQSSDLAEPNADWVEPLALDAWGHRLWTVPPNSQGYLTLAAAWIADGLDLPTDPARDRWAHLLIEAARQAAFDRVEVLHEHADGRALLAPERLSPRRDAIDDDRASVVAGSHRDGGTMYMCAVDGDRMGVSFIQSNAADFGAHVFEPNTRISLQNRGTGFSLEPGHPAEYGPRRRPPHTLAPALVTRLDGSLAMTIGTMGGDSQPQIVLQLLARILHAGETPGDAMAAPRWDLHSRDGGGFDTWDDPAEIDVRLEEGAPRPWWDGLVQRGHTVVEHRAWSMGHAHVIAEQDGVLAGAADPRTRTGAATGY